MWDLGTWPDLIDNSSSEIEQKNFIEPSKSVLQTSEYAQATSNILQNKEEQQTHTHEALVNLQEALSESQWRQAVIRKFLSIIIQSPQQQIELWQKISSNPNIAEEIKDASSLQEALSLFPEIFVNQNLPALKESIISMKGIGRNIKKEVKNLERIAVTINNKAEDSQASKKNEVITERGESERRGMVLKINAFNEQMSKVLPEEWTPSDEQVQKALRVLIPEWELWQNLKHIRLFNTLAESFEWDDSSRAFQETREHFNTHQMCSIDMGSKSDCQIVDEFIGLVEQMQSNPNAKAIFSQMQIAQLENESSEIFKTPIHEDTNVLETPETWTNLEEDLESEPAPAQMHEALDLMLELPDVQERIEASEDEVLQKQWATYQDSPDENKALGIVILYDAVGAATTKQLLTSEQFKLLLNNRKLGTPLIDDDFEQKLTKLYDLTKGQLSFVDEDIDLQERTEALESLFTQVSSDTQTILEGNLRDIREYDEVLNNLDNDADEVEQQIAEEFEEDNTDIFDPTIDDLNDYENGHPLTLSDGVPAQVTISPDGEPMLAIENIPMRVEIATDTEKRDQLVQEWKLLGMNYFSSDENFAVFDAINEAMRFGGDDMPSAQIDITDGISFVGGERDAYLVVREFFQEVKWGAQIAMDALFQQVDHQERATTSEDERFREAILGYSGQEGIFQRDALIQKFKAFCINRTTQT